MMESKLLRKSAADMEKKALMKFMTGMEARELDACAKMKSLLIFLQPTAFPLPLRVSVVNHSSGAEITF